MGNQRGLEYRQKKPPPSGTTALGGGTTARFSCLMRESGTSQTVDRLPRFLKPLHHLFREIGPPDLYIELFTPNHDTVVIVRVNASRQVK